MPPRGEYVLVLEDNGGSWRGVLVGPSWGLEPRMAEVARLAGSRIVTIRVPVDQIETDTGSDPEEWMRGCSVLVAVGGDPWLLTVPVLSEPSPAESIERMGQALRSILASDTNRSDPRRGMEPGGACAVTV